MAVNLVATINVGEVWYADYTLPSMRAYAQRVGADFLEFRFFEKNASDAVSPVWLKLETLHFLAGQTRYRAMLLLDADQLILPRCPSLFETSDERLSVVQDMGMPVVDERFENWCERNHGYTPQPGPYFNTGMLYVPLPAANALVRHLRGPFCGDGYQDQDYLNFVAQRHRLDLRWLPHKYNWLAPQMFDDAVQQCIVHFVGTHKQILPSFVRRLSCHLWQLENRES